MICSMTGYGKAERELGTRKVSIEISSVNHRYLDLNIRMPRMLTYLEEEVRTIIRQNVARGKIDVNISSFSKAEEDIEIIVNEPLATEYLRATEKLSKKLSITNDIKLSDLISISDLITVNKKVGNLEETEELIKDTLKEALQSLINMRQKEGENLKIDLLNKSKSLKEQVSRIESLSLGLVEYYRERLQNRIERLVGEKISIDETRIAMEVAVLADKSAIDEEITRLSSHFNQLEQILIEGGTIGRKLDFLMQEMNREVNTIGSKANDYEITKIVVLLKTEIEKIREQIQNLE